MLKLGDINLDVPFYQAPLSGYTDRAMRVLAHEYGAPLTYTGIILAKIVLHKKAFNKLFFQPRVDEGLVGAQILGGDPEIMAEAAAAFLNVGFNLIDLNFACPAPKVLRRHSGGYLLKDPETAIEILRSVRNTVSCPVTIKLRAGFDKSQESIDKFWQICQGAVAEGIDALVIHGRSVKELYRDKGDWEILSEVKREFPQATIIGSGDLMDAKTIVKRLKSSGLDGVIIARGAIGNPWIFNETRALWEGRSKPEKPDLTEQGEVLLRHYEMIAESRPMLKSIRYFRKFAVGYSKHHPKRKMVQADLIAAKKRDELYATVKKWYGVG
ncbi:MAG: tRNA-dihydrouridine synthase family protein [Candidatus Scalindua sp.]|jgi:tRNA-dihydrouridine synthase B|nr:tRNA-dihydrouridine synthase family protein [Candidatus Scalindua sp.]MBT5303608.1 tRNA-dihydrouridine synthase family protein [Candidatus Scalindua sp.]MBT6047931.1 tRNA-dihydrouridine synthase family protein [Candidatus Scalindua sp.]MBT6227949.1 tRNA-dihydrouridine synthase family protein [Candidatus Scalindua sp.]MBT6563956.1 tRNA-dihydrouridine synthase family protein [Candidatus Scalindua sp.]